MAFTPILSDKALSYATNNTYYRNTNREALWGEPVYFIPYNRAVGLNGFGGPHYEEGYNYNNSPETALGNCTWWCGGRLQETENKNIVSLLGGASPNANEWWNNFTGTRYTNANNAVAGDIICFSGGTDGHVMFIEKIENGIVYISHSAWSYKSYWSGYACRVNTYNVSDIYANNQIDMYKGYDGNTFYVTVQGIIHTGSGSPGPQPEPVTPSISIVPSSYSVTMESDQDYVDFPFNITISGIPDGESASGGNTWSSQLSRIANTGWSYTSYTGSDGNIYQRATKSQTLRYERESDGEYSITTHMYFNLTFSNGSINTDTVMRIIVEKKKAQGILMLEWDGATVQIL